MNQKGFANIVLILVIVTVIAVGGYFVFSKKSVTPTNTPTSNQAANNEMAIKPSIAPSQKTIDSNKEIEFTFLAPKGAVQSKIYLSCESGLYAYFSDNITPRTPTPYPNICNTWQENAWDHPTLVRYIRDIKFKNDTTQGKVATLQMTVTMPDSSVLKSDLSSITINPASTSSSGTVDWETCINTKYGYEAKYPPTWKVWKPGAPEARLANCDENLAIIALSPNLFEYPISRITQVNINVSDQERLRGTIYEGSKSLDDYFTKNPSILQNSPKVKETTIDGERLVWLEGNWLLSFHNGSIFDFRVYNVDNVTLDNFIRAFKFR